MSVKEPQMSGQPTPLFGSPIHRKRQPNPRLRTRIMFWQRLSSKRREASLPSESHISSLENPEMDPLAPNSESSARSVTLD